MHYITVSKQFNPKITGTNKISSLEFKKTSFVHKSDGKVFFEHLDDWDKANIDSFEPFDPKILQGEITLYPVGKRVKKLDFMGVCPHLCGIWMAVSKKALSIIQKYKLPKHTLIPVNIDTYDEPYYLIGFPLVTIEHIDYSKSEFINTKNFDIISFSNENEYRDDFFASAKNIILKNNYHYDILNLATVTEICLTQKLLKDLLDNNCVGLEIQSLEKINVSTP